MGANNESKYTNKVKKNFGAFYIAPSILLLVFVYVYPITRVIRDSFYRFSGGVVTYIGFDNYLHLILRDQNSRVAVMNNLKLLGAIPILLITSLVFAFLFYEGVKGGKVYQAIIFIPKVISIVVVGIVFSYLLRTTGLINHFLELINLDFLRIDWLGDRRIAIYSIMLTFVWKELGFGIMLFHARLVTLDESVLDASKVDGANWYQRFIHVIIPQLKGIISFFIIYHVMIVFAWIFAYVYIISGGGPGSATTVLELEIYKWAFERNLRGLASALAVMLIAGVFIFIFFQHMVRRKGEE